ncbi:histidinol dehydrogenase [Candidatus Caldatribacterium saccharofermentans]|uniref:Histidinol dehydrogenase n=1 Tax=Candidatus Caldatribacterium saccharofermentans TaxID=1454753 RepID=A0A7V4TFM7_9BACT
MKIVLKPLGNLEDVTQDLAGNRRKLYEYLKEAESAVEEIIENVKDRGDAALREYTERFDGCRLTTFRVPPEELERAFRETPEELKAAIALAARNIRSFHETQKMTSFLLERQSSVLGELVRPLRRVACYIPGGRFAYPSSCLMTVIPAQIAGVQEIALLTPPKKDGNVHKEVLAAAFFLGVQEVYRIGGAQAIAAACFGTESIPPVEKIVGPGNIYVTAAKKRLQGIVGIDGLAGPSEVAIIADHSAPPEWVALDLLAQAEHDPLATSVLFSPSEALLFEVKKYLEQEIANAPSSFGQTQPLFLYQVEDLEVALAAVNLLAPEHVEVVTKDPLALLPRLQKGGAIFLGPHAPVALGDYGYGPNHVLPTWGTAVFSSPLSVRDFYTFSSFVFPSPPDPTLEYETYAYLAREEGLFFHQRSLLARAGKKLLTDIERGWERT